MPGVHVGAGLGAAGLPGQGQGLHVRLRVRHADHPGDDLRRHGQTAHRRVRISRHPKRRITP